MIKDTRTDYEKYGFKRSDVIEILGGDFFPNGDEQTEQIVNTNKQNENNITKIPTEALTITEWEPKFAGRKHALEIISALSKALAEKSGRKFHYGENISASALAECVIEQFDGGNKDLYRRLISEALKETGITDSE